MYINQKFRISGFLINGLNYITSHKLLTDLCLSCSSCVHKTSRMEELTNIFNIYLRVQQHTWQFYSDILM